MNDFVREEEDILYGEHLVTAMPLFRSELTRLIDSRRDQLFGVMEAFILAKTEVTGRQITKHLIKDNFGVFHSKDYREIFKRFCDLKLLVPENLGGKIDDRTYKVAQRS